MAQQADQTVYDGASTPVGHLLYANGVKTISLREESASWKEAAGGVPDYAQMRLNQGIKRLKSGVSNVYTWVDVAVMEAIGSQNAQGYTAPPKVAYSDRVGIVQFAAERSTEVSRRLALQILINWYNNIATTVTPVSAGVCATMHQKLIMPN